MADAREIDKLKSALGPRADCPPLPELAWALDRDAGDDRRRSAEEHLAGCEHCRDELALANEFSEVRPRSEEARDVRWIVGRLDKQQVAPRRRRAFGFFWGMQAWAAAACLLLIAGGAFYMRRGPGEPLVPVEDGVLRSHGVELAAPTGNVAPPTEFRWRAVAGAVRYRVRVMEVDRREIWQGEADGTSLPTPAPLASALAPGRTLLWQVAALDSSGKVVAESPAQSFHIERAAR